MYTLHTRFCTFGTDLHARSVLINKISASELSRKFTKGELLVGFCSFCSCHVQPKSSELGLSQNARETDTQKNFLWEGNKNILGIVLGIYTTGWSCIVQCKNNLMLKTSFFATKNNKKTIQRPRCRVQRCERKDVEYENNSAELSRILYAGSSH